MKKHPYYGLVAALKQIRNQLIADYQHFKRDRVNRTRMPQNCFSLTRNAFRSKLQDVDLLIAGAKAALLATRETGEMHYFDHELNLVVLQNPHKK